MLTVMYASPKAYAVSCVHISWRVPNLRIAESRKEADETSSEECCAALGGKRCVSNSMDLEGEK
jgi:hypothetical protein